MWISLHSHVYCELSIWACGFLEAVSVERAIATCTVLWLLKLAVVSIGGIAGQGGGSCRDDTLNAKAGAREGLATVKAAVAASFARASSFPSVQLDFFRHGFPEAHKVINVGQAKGDRCFIFLKSRVGGKGIGVFHKRKFHSATDWLDDEILLYAVERPSPLPGRILEVGVRGAAGRAGLRTLVLFGILLGSFREGNLIVGECQRPRQDPPIKKNGLEREVFRYFGYGGHTPALSLATSTGTLTTLTLQLVGFEGENSHGRMSLNELPTNATAPVLAS